MIDVFVIFSFLENSSFSTSFPPFSCLPLSLSSMPLLSPPVVGMQLVREPRCGKYFLRYLLRQDLWPADFRIHPLEEFISDASEMLYLLIVERIEHVVTVDLLLKSSAIGFASFAPFFFEADVGVLFHVFV